MTILPPSLPSSSAGERPTAHAHPAAVDVFDAPPPEQLEPEDLDPDVSARVCANEQIARYLRGEQP